MPTAAKLPLAMLIAVAWSSTALADDPRCSRPPYGGSPDRYRAMQERYGRQLETITPTIQEVCNIKFSGADRAPLLKLGFSNADIDGGDTETLVVELLNKTKSPPK